MGVDRGVAVSVALSSGELLSVPGLRAGETQRLRRLQRRLARARRGSQRRARTKLAIAKLRAREAERRRDWVEKTTTDLARRFDMIRIEDLKVSAMTRSARGTREHPGTRVAQKRGLNREISRQGWGLLVARLKHKAKGRLQFVPAAYTSQRCSYCGHVAPENRKSQAVFQCVACGAGPCNADVNAARNIAAGRAVTAHGETSALASLRTVNLNSVLLPHRQDGEGLESTGLSRRRTSMLTNLGCLFGGLVGFVWLIRSPRRRGQGLRSLAECNRAPGPARPAWLAWLATDVIGVLVFCAVGRRSHAEGLSVTGIASTAWPFSPGPSSAGWRPAVGGAPQPWFPPGWSSGSAR